MLSRLSKKIAGFSTVEIILSIALFAMLVLALSASLSFGVQQLNQNAQDSKASFLLDEGLEAVANINSRGFAYLTPGAHGLINNSVAWNFTGTQDVIDNYTRVVTISSVDAYTVDAVVSISWLSNLVRARTIQATERFTDYNRTITPTATPTPTVVPVSWTTPIQQSTVDMTGGTGAAIQVGFLGTMAYIIKGTNVNPDFAAMNFSNPAAPVESWNMNVSGNNFPRKLALAGNYAFVATGTNNGEIRIINLTTHTESTTINVTGNNIVAKCYYDSNYLYVIRTASTTGQFVIYNVTNPLAPALTSTLTIPTNALIVDMVVSGNYAYLASSVDASELTVVNVTNKAAPVILGAGLNLTGAANGAVINILGNTVFMGRTGDSSIYVINVTTPGTPALLGTPYNIGGAPSSFSFGAPNNNYMFVSSANAARDFQVVDISNLSALNTVGFINTTSTLNFVTYVPAGDITLGASANVSGEFVIFKPN